MKIHNFSRKCNRINESFEQFKANRYPYAIAFVSRRTYGNPYLFTIHSDKHECIILQYEYTDFT